MIRSQSRRFHHLNRRRLLFRFLLGELLRARGSVFRPHTRQFHTRNFYSHHARFSRPLFCNPGPLFPDLDASDILSLESLECFLACVFAPLSTEGLLVHLFAYQYCQISLFLLTLLKASVRLMRCPSF